VKKKIFFVSILKITDEQDPEPDPHPHPDPLVKDTDPRIWLCIWIRTKMSRIRETDFLSSLPIYSVRDGLSCLYILPSFRVGSRMILEVGSGLDIRNITFSSQPLYVYETSEH
jgi:hypothetical protein